MPIIDFDYLTLENKCLFEVKNKGMVCSSQKEWNIDAQSLV